MKLIVGLFESNIKYLFGERFKVFDKHVLQQMITTITTDLNKR